MNYRHFILPLMAILILGVLAGTSCDKLKNIKGSISGVVYLDGRPTSGHLLIKDAATGGVVAMGDTNMDGHFYIKDLNAGNYVVQYLNMQGVPFGGEVKVTVRMGRPESADIKVTSADRLNPSQYK